MRTNPQRLEALRALAILDTAPEVVFDDITRMAASCFGVPIAMVNLLDRDRDWFKSCIGFPVSESPATTSFCEQFFHTDVDVLVAEDTAIDALFANHPLVTGAPHIRFYAAARLMVNGAILGTVCAYDVLPHRVNALQIERLRELANAAMAQLQARGNPAPISL